jgi:stringent starvation protein B
MDKMSTFKPYVVKASYDWILDNDMTPQVIVNTGFDGVDVPPAFRGAPGDVAHKILLNISPTATSGLLFDMKGKLISFYSNFSGSIYPVKFPFAAIESIHSRESGEGNLFKMDYTKTNGPEKKAARPALRLVN